MGSWIVLSVVVKSISRFLRLMVMLVQLAILPVVSGSWSVTMITILHPNTLSASDHILLEEIASKINRDINCNNDRNPLHVKLNPTRLSQFLRDRLTEKIIGAGWQFVEFNLDKNDAVESLLLWASKSERDAFRNESKKS